MRLPRLLNATRCLRAAAAFGLVGCSGLLSGCILDVPSFIDPGETAGLRMNKEPLVVQVLEELDPAMEQGNRDFAMAQPPRPEDMSTERTDYVVGPGDLLQITVFNLEGQGLQTQKTTGVSGTGNITLPFLQEVVRAEGLTELELQQAIADAYGKAGVIESPNVSVAVMQQRNSAYTVTGSVVHEGEYVVPPTENFRVLNALSQAGGVSNALIEEIYIFRPTDEGARRHDAGGAGRPATGPAGGGPGGQTQPAAPDELAPPPAGRAPQSSNSLFRNAPKTLKKSVLLQEQGAAPATARTAAETLAPETVEANAQAEVIPEDNNDASRVGRIDGKDVVVQPGEQAPAPAPDDAGMAPRERSTTEPFAFDAPDQASTTRVIRIPLSRLRTGDLQYNIPIRARDIIMVPPGLVGFYYMHGHIVNTGAYQFAGQKVTLKQAIASARGLDGLAIPQRTEIIRRIGPDREMFYHVDLAAVFAGKRPDIYLKPNDTVSVGTNFVAPFLAAVRGGFRLTYGFGFLYDRNFASAENNEGNNGR